MSKYDYLTPNSTPTKLPKSQRSRQRREPSGVFSLFQPNQVQLFREAFSLIDHDADGVVTEQDLKHIFASLGISASKQRVDDLLSDRPGTHSRNPSADFDSAGDRGITFPMFLTMMGEHLYDFDTEQELLGAFECFDENDSGFVKVDEMRKWLSESGERMDHSEIDKLLKGPFTDRQGNFNYREWVKVLRINADNEEQDPF
ncbi:EF-hand protein [Thelephora terrestris]|uniref:EF-hand protein n=1 Tax=Thelephora terrestris TaxID=56493 RepID=A0A9P6L0Q6_9AGAM|nr:EF-hand protein [Thelephora terrestris]